MPYQLHIPEPNNTNERSQPIPLQCLIKKVEPVANGSKGVKGLFTEDRSWINYELVDISSIFYWRGDLARSWAVYYLSRYEKVSDYFLSHKVGLHDVLSTMSSLKGKQYRLPIHAEKGSDINEKGQIVKCVWYYLNEDELAGGEQWQPAA